MSIIVKLAIGNDFEVGPVRPAASSALEHRLRRRFRASSYAGLHDIECDCQEGAVVLRGEVASFFLKQVAQELVRNVWGVERVTNRIDVVEALRDRHGWSLGDR